MGVSARERDRVVRRLNEVEGYLTLGLPERALEILRRHEWGTMQFESSKRTGEALVALGRFREALGPLEQAAKLCSDDPEVAVALGWCYKRTHRLAQAIDALERARDAHPEQPILHYNLACYWSLASQPAKALAELSIALRLEPELLGLIPGETDFDSIRDHAGFEQLTGHARTS